MEAVRRRNPVTQLGFAAILVPILLFAGGGCSHAMRAAGTMRALSEGLDGPPGNNAATREYVDHGIHFDDGEYGHIDATFTADNVKVRIEPEITSDTVNWHGALTDDLAYGKFVARISRLDNVDVPTLGLDKDHRYSYLWVGPINSSGRRRVAFYTFNADLTIYKGPVSQISQITRCRDNSERKPAVYLNKDHTGARCKVVNGLAASGAAPQRGVQLASVTPKFGRASSMDGGLWISCSGGCCDIGAFQ